MFSSSWDSLCCVCVAVYIELDFDLCWQAYFAPYLYVSGTLEDKRLSLVITVHQIPCSEFVFPNTPIPDTHPQTDLFCYLYYDWTQAQTLTHTNRPPYFLKCSHTLWRNTKVCLLIFMGALPSDHLGGVLSCRPQIQSDAWCKGGFREAALHLIDLLLFHQQRWELLLSHD